MRECKESLRSVHSRRVLRLDLATGKSLEWHTCEAYKGAEGSRQLLHYRKNFQSGQTIRSQLKLTTRSSREVESPDCPIWLKLTLRIPYTRYYKYPYTHEM